MKYNTIALAYLNKEGEIISWSADTFGSPREYPKTYLDSEETRKMLKKKFESREKFGEAVSDTISSVSPVAGSLMKESLKEDSKKFIDREIVSSAIYLLQLITDYSKGIPERLDVIGCINDRAYTRLDD